MLALLAFAITSCALWEEPEVPRIEIETRFVPVLLKPVIPEIPAPPVGLAEQFPDPVVLTAVDVAHYLDVCEMYEAAATDDDTETTAEQILSEYGLSRSAACDWAIYGQTVQGNLTVEGIFNQLAGYTEALRLHIDFLNQIIKNMYDATQDSDVLKASGIE